jgi:hypothetical protein
MTHFRTTRFSAWLASAAVMALLFGLEFPDSQLSGEPSPLPNDHTMVIAVNEAPSGQSQVQTDENANESARPGEESGAQTSDKSDKDAKKPDQPPGAHPGNAN